LVIIAASLPFNSGYKLIPSATLRFHTGWIGTADHCIMVRIIAAR
jgi:hypothetical protein